MPAVSDSSDDTLSPGRELGNYRVLGLLGKGGMSCVYRAKDKILGRDIALKVLPARMAMNRPQRFEQFLQEAKSAARLDHPNVVTIYHIDQHQGTWYVAMELVEGRSLKELIDEHGQMDLHFAVDAAVTIGEALAMAHERGILHRDIKPSNLMVGRHRVIKITDFGLAAEWDVEVRRGQTQRAVGTPLYMAPELCYGHPPTPSTDMYALGMTLFVMITADKPFSGKDVMDTFKKQVNAQVPDIREIRPEAPSGLASIVARLLAKNPHGRYAWVDEMVEDLRRLRRTELAGVAEANGVEEALDVESQSSFSDSDPPMTSSWVFRKDPGSARVVREQIDTLQPEARGEARPVDGSGDLVKLDRWNQFSKGLSANADDDSETATQTSLDLTSYHDQSLPEMPSAEHDRLRLADDDWDLDDDARQHYQTTSTWLMVVVAILMVLLMVAILLLLKGN